MAVCQALPVDGIGEHVVVVRGDKDLSDAAGLLFVVNPDGLSFVPEHVKRPTSINRGQAEADVFLSAGVNAGQRVRALSARHRAISHSLLHADRSGASREVSLFGLLS